jgi:hypothetical protein
MAMTLLEADRSATTKQPPKAPKIGKIKVKRTVRSK